MYDTCYLQIYEKYYLQCTTSTAYARRRPESTPAPGPSPASGTRPASSGRAASCGRGQRCPRRRRGVLPTNVRDVLPPNVCTTRATYKYTKSTTYNVRPVLPTHVEDLGRHPLQVLLQRAVLILGHLVVPLRELDALHRAAPLLRIPPAIFRL